MSQRRASGLVLKGLGSVCGLSKSSHRTITYVPSFKAPVRGTDPSPGPAASGAAASGASERVTKGADRGASGSGPDPIVTGAVPGSKQGSKNLGWLVTGLGVPALALWYWYQNQLQQEHENGIASVFRQIQEQKGIKPKVPPAPKPPPASPAATAPKSPTDPASAPAAVTPSAPAASSSSSSTSGADAPAKQEAVSPPAAAAVAAAVEAATVDHAAASSTTAPLAQEPAPAAAAGSVAPHSAGPAAATSPAPAAAGAAGIVDAQPGPAPAAPAELGTGLKAEAVLEAVAGAGQQQEGGDSRPQVQAAAAEAHEVAGDVVAALAHAAAGGYEYKPLPPGSLPEPGAHLPPVPKGVMGVQLDLSPAGLVRGAIERGQGAGEDWSAFTHRHKQAVSDAELFSAAVEQVRAWHDTEMARVQALADSNAARAAEVLALAKAASESFKRLLKQHQDMAAELRELEVRQATKRANIAAAAAAEAERKERLATLDELRAQLGALAAAHDARAQQQAVAHASHATALGILGVGAALEAGAPLAPALAALGARAGADANQQGGEVVDAAVRAIPSFAAARGIPTEQELGARFRAMRGAVLQMGTLPLSAPGAVRSDVAPVAGAGGGGILAHSVARVAAWLKVDEAGVVRALGTDAALARGGIDTAVAAAESELAAGRLARAADILRSATQGTAAAAAVQSWCDEARARAVADQSLKMLRAHATSLAASLV